MDTVIGLHGYVIGFAIVGSWLLICLWALVLRLLRREHTPLFWRAVSLAQMLLVVQLGLGLFLLGRWAMGIGNLPAARAFDNVFHPLYGVVFPFVVLFFAHKWAREGRWHPHTVFSLAALTIFGLTARSWMVGALA